MRNLVKTNRISNWLKHKKLVLTTCLLTMACTTFASASTTTTTTTTAEAKWETIIDFIVPWIYRLGGVTILIGAVMFGMAFKDDDAEGKTKGMRTVIAGAIVTAVSLSADLFLA